MVRGSGAARPSRGHSAGIAAYPRSIPTGKFGGAAEIYVPSFSGWQRLRRAQLQAKVSTTQRARTLRPAAPAACCHRSRTCRSHWRHFAPAMAMIYMTSCSCGPLTADTLHANLAGLRTLRADRASRVHSGHVTREDSALRGTAEQCRSAVQLQRTQGRARHAHFGSCAHASRN